MRQRLSQLIEFVRGAMKFQANQISHLESFGQHCTDVIEMRQNAIGIGVSFATENFIAVDAEAIEEILRLSLGLLDKIGK